MADATPAVEIVDLFSSMIWMAFCKRERQNAGLPAPVFAILVWLGLAAIVLPMVLAVFAINRRDDDDGY